MKEIYSDFYRVAMELDELSLEGFFGESIKGLVKTRKLKNSNQYLMDSIRLWLNEKDQYGKENVKEFILIFLKIFTESIKNKGQEAIDVISSFWLGSKENTEIECFSAYAEYSRLHMETRKLIRELTSNPTLSTKKKTIASISSTYSKGVELIGKILTICIVLKEVSKGNSYNFYKISNLKLYEKIDLFNVDNNVEHKKITDAINRKIRNSEAHLSLNFDFNSSHFLIKTKSKDRKNRIINERISFEQMMLKLYPSIGWITQGFVYSGVLYILAHEDYYSYKNLINEIDQI